jgi:hypothetical protein
MSGEMLRFASILTLTLILGGCAAQIKQPPAQSRTPRAPQSTGLALVLDPPAIAGQPPVELARAARRPGAFGSYQDLTTTYFSIQTIDRQTSDWTDRYERRTEMNRVGVSYR